MKLKKLEHAMINVAWIENGESYAKTLPMDQAYALKDRAKEDDNIVVWWFQRI